MNSEVAPVLPFASYLKTFSNTTAPLSPTPQQELWASGLVDWGNINITFLLGKAILATP